MTHGLLARRIFATVSLLSLTILSAAHAIQHVPANLGGGLARLVALDAVTRGLLTQAQFDARPDARINVPALLDNQQRVCVNIILDGTAALPAVQSSIAALGDINLKGSLANYSAGVIEAYVPVGKAADLARLPGVRAVHLVPKPVTNVGATDSHGVVQHRVNLVHPTGITGAGVTVGVISDSFNTSTQDALGGPQTVKYQHDQVTGDLPGPLNTQGRLDPVVVLEDYTAPAGSSSTDEGRGMCQIVHDIAPGAKLAFATAFGGAVGFANNIRRLAASPSATPAGAACNVIVDDVSYLDEPMFEDGIIARAADDVFAQGVPYFSSAGNRPATMSYSSTLRFVPGTAASAAGTNIDLTGVPPELYAGGFHDFNPGAAVDIAQTFSGSPTVSFQYDEPYDQITVPTVEPSPIQSGSGTVTLDQDGDGSDPVVVPFVNSTPGRAIEIFADGDGAPTECPDTIIDVFDPNGRQIAHHDTVTNPERLLIFLPDAGTYQIQINGFDATPGTPGGESIGGVIYEIRNATGLSGVTTDLNVLFFDADGAYVGAFAADNRATNRPIELGTPPDGAEQMIIARGNIPPAAPQPASRVKYVFFSDGEVEEYFNYQSPVTFGHNSANGANGVAAYPFYAPYVPEGFTSPGPATIVFDKNHNRLATPEVRLKPDMAAMDGANTTFFPTLVPAVGDALQDDDQFPNFFGTSAAAPHAAAIAALVVSKYGVGGVTPTQIRKILQQSAFQHDLDPYVARASAKAGTTKVTVTAQGNQEFHSQFNLNFFTVDLVGPSSLTLLRFDGANGNPTETPVGMRFDERVFAGTAFELGDLRGVTAANVTHAAENPDPDQRYRTLRLDIAPGALTGGEGFGFGIDRDELNNAGTFTLSDGAELLSDGNSADLLGDGVLIPQGTVVNNGMVISGTLQNGMSFSGRFLNRIGRGYSSLDGFGFINAEAALNAPLP